MPNPPALTPGNPIQRRTIVQAGMLGAMAGGLGISPFRRAAFGTDADAATLNGFGRAKACIFIFLWGGPSHLDTLDPKPEAPNNVRGPFQPIATKTPGLFISELLPGLAARSDKLAVIRSLHHSDPAHLSSAHAALTGHLAPVFPSDAEPPSERDTPHLGSVISALKQPRVGLQPFVTMPSVPDAPSVWDTAPSNGLPSFVTMPWLAFHPAAPGGKAPGQHGGWLGHRYDPLLIEGDPSQENWEVPALQLQQQVTSDRLNRRATLLESIDAQQAELNRCAQGKDLSALQQRAYGLLTSSTVREAFHIQAEPAEVRDRYGRNLHGQCVLLARRLVEHGVPFVSVNWHNDGKAFWDTHGNNFNRLKDDLCPPADKAFSALLDDLDSRGMLDETIIAWVGEFGRSPVINNGTGREHHPFCYSGALAGGGIQGGTLYGASDAQGFYPAVDPVTQHAYAATLMHALGVDPQAVLHDRERRPQRLYNAPPLVELFG